MNSPPERSGALNAADVGAGAAELGVPLTALQSQQLASFAALLMRWNAVHNLTAIDSQAAVFSHHLLDSLAIVPSIVAIVGQSEKRALDVGSGGGLPAVPLAIACPMLDVTAVDKVQKKAAFLLQAKLDLRLANFAAVHSRIEDLRGPPFDLITSRAFASLAEFVGLTRHLLAPGGWWAAMKGALHEHEIREAADRHPDVRVVETVKLDVPRLGAERHLILLQIA